MSSLQLSVMPMPVIPPPEFEFVKSNWYAIHTMAKHEKWIARQLEEKRILTFLPLVLEVHRWSDRRVIVEVPLFGCYAFVRIPLRSEERLKVLRIPGVLGFVGSDRQGTPIPDIQIENLRAAIREKIPCAAHPFISVGQRVRIRGGSLDGIEGIFIREGGEQTVVVSVELLQRSVAIRVEGYGIEAV
jgi:transcription antitermination factor NusG